MAKPCPSAAPTWPAGWRRQAAAAALCLAVLAGHLTLLAGQSAPPLRDEAAQEAGRGSNRPASRPAGAMGAADVDRPGDRPAAGPSATPRSKPVTVRVLPTLAVAPPFAPAAALATAPATAPAAAPPPLRRPQPRPGFPPSSQPSPSPPQPQAPAAASPADSPPERAAHDTPEDNPPRPVATASTAASDDATPEAQPPPVYPTAPPPPATRHFQLQRGGQRAAARLQWAPAGGSYSLSLMAEGGELDGLGAASRGQLGSLGLVPERYVDRRRGRDQRAANFNPERREVRGSGGGAPRPWPLGGQDRLSWLLQLAAVLQANPDLAQPGQQVVLAVAGPQGPSTVWTFQVRGMEALSLADGQPARGLALRRLPAFAYDLQVDVWLDPADHHLPLRLRLAAPPSDWASVWLRQPAPAAP